MYSVFSLANAIVEALDLGQKQSIGLENLLVSINYVSAFLPVMVPSYMINVRIEYWLTCILQGIAPTLISLRIGHESGSSTSSGHAEKNQPLSVLKFHRSQPARGEDGISGGELSEERLDINHQSLLNTPGRRSVDGGEKATTEMIMGREEV
jgi:hypothetical protein